MESDDIEFVARIKAVKASGAPDDEKHAQFHALLDEASRSMPPDALGVVGGCDRCPRPSSSVLN